MTQLDLDFRVASERKATPAEVATLVSLLEARGAEWTTAAAITAALGWPDRKVRAVASDSDGQVVSHPGSHGYVALTRATPGDIEHAIRAIDAQAQEMSRRAQAIRRRYHSFGRDRRNG